MLKWNELQEEDIIKAIVQYARNNVDNTICSEINIVYDNELYPVQEIAVIAYFKHFRELVDKSSLPSDKDLASILSSLNFKVEGIELKEESKENVVDDNEEFDNLNDYQEYKNPKPLKVGMYVQTFDVRNEIDFEKMVNLVRKSDIDLLVFPEGCYVPGKLEDYQCQYDLFTLEGQKRFAEAVKELSTKLGKSVVYSGLDCGDMVFSMFYNLDTDDYITYVKHTMTNRSIFDPGLTGVFDLENYKTNMFSTTQTMFFRGYNIGLTICYDCNHAAFSSIYGYSGADIIINSTGGDVQYKKWYKYNKARAIENNCFNLVTMGQTGTKKGKVNCSYGFNPLGGELDCYNLEDGKNDYLRTGSVHIYEIDFNKLDNNVNFGTPDITLDQIPSVSKEDKCVLKVPVCGMSKLLDSFNKINDYIYVKECNGKNVVVIWLDGNEIIYPEIYLELMYNTIELDNIPNKAYVIYNTYEHIDAEFYEKQLSVIFKVRAMESFCAIVVEADNFNMCYQTSFNRESQLIEPVENNYLVDLTRCTGPEAIWTNKDGMRACWRDGYSWLVEYLYNLGQSSLDEDN